MYLLQIRKSSSRLFFIDGLLLQTYNGLFQLMIPYLQGFHQKTAFFQLRGASIINKALHGKGKPLGITHGDPLW